MKQVTIMVEIKGDFTDAELAEIAWRARRVAPFKARQVTRALVTLDEQVEALIDRYGMSGLAESVSRVAVEKAGHIKGSYDDQALSNLWNWYAARFDNLAQALRGDHL
jgi:hypothetical protein